MDMAKRIANEPIRMPGTVPDKLQPHNIEAEESVIGALLIDSDAIIRVQNLVEPRDFYIERNRWVYEAILALSKKRMAADLITVSDELELRAQLDEIGGVAYLSGLMAEIPTSVHAEYYAKIVHRGGKLRQLIDASGKIARLAYSEDQDIERIFNEAGSIILPVFTDIGKRDLTSLGKVMDRLMDRVELARQNPDALTGIPTGLTDLDRLLGGLQRSDLILLASRPGMGKTALAMNIALKAAKLHQKRVAAFSLEMSDEQLAQRLVSTETGIETNRLRLGDIKDHEWADFMKATNLLSGIPIHVDDTPAISFFELRTKSLRLAAEQGLDVLIIDYLQLMRGDGKQENRQQEISYISRNLKALARELNIPILALSQLNRDLESRRDKRPILSDLRESGSLEQDADEVLFIYRDDMYNPDTEFPNIAEIIVGKNRHGPTGVMSSYFRRHRVEFVDLEIRQQPLEY